MIRSHLVTGLKNGVQYVFTVQAFKADGEATAGDPLPVTETPSTFGGSETPGDLNKRMCRGCRLMATIAPRGLYALDAFLGCPHP